jgi:hypothetical protein
MVTSEQHGRPETPKVGPNAGLVVSKLLPLAAKKSGPANVSRLREPRDADRRTLSREPDVSTLDPSKDRSGVVLKLLTLEPSKTFMKLAASVDPPVWIWVFTAANRGPVKPRLKP